MWKKINHRCWEREDGKRIVKDYKPCKGGVVFVVMDGKKIVYCASLEAAQTLVENLSHG